MLTPYLHFVDINLEENKVGVFLTQLRKDRSHEPAWSAPGGGEVHNNLEQDKKKTISIVTLHSTHMKQRNSQLKKKLVKLILYHFALTLGLLDLVLPGAAVVDNDDIAMIPSHFLRYCTRSDQIFTI